MYRHYDCDSCEDMNCNVCPACGRDPSKRATTDSYRKSVKKGYYSSSIIPKRDENGKIIGYGYNKLGE